MRHGDVRFAEVFRLLDAVVAISGQAVEETECPPVFGEDTLGQVGALYQKVPVEIREALRRDEVELVMEEPTRVVVHRKEQLMVDSDGRFIFRNIPQVAPANWSYGFDLTIQPGYPEVLEGFEHAFERKDFISATQFEDKAEAKKREMVNNPRWEFYTSIFLGKHARPFAIALPQMDIPEGGLGEALARIFVPAAKRGYLRKYAKRQFNDYRGDSLIGQTETFPGSRQERFIEALRQRPQVLWVFMNCLQGGSFNASRQLILQQPDEFMLGGTLVNAPVIAAYPEIAAASKKNPLYFCAADVFQRGGSLSLHPSGADVRFDYRYDLGGYGACSAAVAVLA